MIKEKMYSSLQEYEEMLIILKDEIKRIKGELRGYTKLQNIATKYNITTDITTDDVKLQLLQDTEEELRLCKSIIRRYKTLLNISEQERVEEV